MRKKITFIGAGSIGFTRNVLSDIMGAPRLRDFDIAFTDIDARNLEMVTSLCQRDIDANGLNIKIHATLNRRDAVTGADYVVNTVRIGGLDAFALDVEVPLWYGVDQCVGDTMSAGGIMYAQRGVNAILEFCKDIREAAKPDCILFNYANPNAMITWACNTYGKVKTIGLCHGVQNGHYLIADALGLKKEEVDITCVGINHMTWYTKILHKGKDMAGKLLDALKKHAEYSKTEKVRIDMLERTGYFSTESNGHLSEYLPYYRKRLNEIEQWIDTSSWINGETAGYLRVCRESRNWFMHDFPAWMTAEPKKYSQENRSIEHISYMIEGLETGKPYRGHFNVINNGCITNLPNDCVVEVPAYADANGINVPIYGGLPWVCASLCLSNINVQRLSVMAAVNGDVELLKQAFLLDPLVSAVLNPKEIWQLADEMLIAQEQWLPQYKKGIAEAKKRIIKSKADGTYIAVNKNFTGSVRLHEHTVEEMAANRQQATKTAAAASKG